MSVLVECPHCATRILPLPGRICPACRENVDQPRKPPDAEIVLLPEAEHDAPVVASRPSSNRYEAPRHAGYEPDRAGPSTISEVNRQGHRMMMFGAMWFIGGLAVTIASYRAAGNGGRFVVTTGAIFFGAVQFVRGAILALK